MIHVVIQEQVTTWTFITFNITFFRHREYCTEESVSNVLTYILTNNCLSTLTYILTNNCMSTLSNPNRNVKYECLLKNQSDMHFNIMLIELSVYRWIIYLNGKFVCILVMCIIVLEYAWFLTDEEDNLSPFYVI